MLNRAKELSTQFRQGDVIIYPTDTVWGVGCILSNEQSLQRLYELKRRENKPFTVLVSSLKMAQKYGQFNDLALKLAKNFWPGGLTLVVPIQEDVATHFENSLKFFTHQSDEGTTIALRIPNQSFLIETIDELGEAIAGPSANPAGHTPPLSKNQVEPAFASAVDYLVDLVFEAKGISSTIVDTTNGRPVILREGDISLGEILKVAT